MLQAKFEEGKAQKENQRIAEALRLDDRAQDALKAKLLDVQQSLSEVEAVALVKGDELYFATETIEELQQKLLQQQTSKGYTDDDKEELAKMFDYELERAKVAFAAQLVAQGAARKALERTTEALRNDLASQSALVEELRREVASLRSPGFQGQSTIRYSHTPELHLLPDATLRESSLFVEQSSVDGGEVRWLPSCRRY